jgi:hypothetical protein
MEPLHFTESTHSIWSIFLTWSNNTPENLAIARQITRELNEIFVAGQVEELGHVNHRLWEFRYAMAHDLPEDFIDLL